ncbi:MAG: 50S ribosomal protein L29 [Lentisphaeraceae bacterium]|nr:50S ribosomal protein L29 [Lentisphaeraceae bacterium]
MKASDIRNLTDEELVTQLKSSKDELLKLRIQGKTGQLENSARISVLKKDIARIHTETTARAKV